MELIDLILGALLVYGLVKGLWKGLFTELASLLSLLAGLYIAVKFSGFTAKLLDGTFTDNPKYTAAVAFGITFIAVVAGVIVLGKVFSTMASFAGLGIINRILGALFGFIKMVLIVSVSLNFFIKMNSSNLFASQETLDDSLFFYPVLKVSANIFPVLEDWFVSIKEDNGHKK